MEFKFETLPDKPGEVFIKEGFNITRSYHTNNVRQFVGDAMHWHNEDGWLGWKNFAGYQLTK